MLFNSLTYIAFMLLLVPLIVHGPGWLRRFLVVFASLVFYAFWRIDFTALIVFSTLTDYLAGKYIARTDNQRVRRAWLIVSLTLNFLILGFFKYTYFINDSFQSLFHLVGLNWMPLNVVTGLPVHMQEWMLSAKPFGIEAIILPLGVSFYTFESISYVIDVYRGHLKPLGRYWTFMSFVLFWPKLVAGPILRTAEVIPQLEHYERPRFREVLWGFEEILQGLFKKIVLADSIAAFSDAGYAQPPELLGTLDVWVLAFAFGLQIYFDFSGYSSIALGSARLMGIHFPRNFNWPYLATSAKDFWKRWHISLSSWIQDYLYIPLQGVKFRKKGEKGLDTEGEQEASFWRRTFALFATWFIMGLWHGANWTYAVWGLWHAVLVFLHRVSQPVRERLPKAVRVVGGWAWTVPTAMLAWLFFRPESLEVAGSRLVTAFNPAKLGTRTLPENFYVLTALIFAGMLLVAALIKAARSGKVPTPVRIVGLALANGIMLFWVFIMLRDVKAFIYFQF